MKIVLGNDRKGFDYKCRLVNHLESLGHLVINVGTDEDVPCDYPIYAAKAAHLVVSGECDYGILICASGEGMVIAANKVNGIRCGLGYNDEVARLCRLHNNANMLAFGQSFQSYEEVENSVDTFLNTDFWEFITPFELICLMILKTEICKKYEDSCNYPCRRYW